MELGDRIANLTLAECAQLSLYLEEVHNIPRNSIKVVEQEEEVVLQPEQTEFDVIIESYHPDKKISLIKVWREISGLGLKEAKDFIDVAAGKTARSKLSKTEAEAIRVKLEEAGAKVLVK